MYPNASSSCFWCPMALMYILGYRTHILRLLTRCLAQYFHILWLTELWFQISSAHQHTKWGGQNYFFIMFHWAGHHLMYTGVKRVLALNLHPLDLKTKQLKLNYPPNALKLRRWLKTAVCEASKYGKSVYCTMSTSKEFLHAVCLKWCVWGTSFVCLLVCFSLD